MKEYTLREIKRALKIFVGRKCLGWLANPPQWKDFKRALKKASNGNQIHKNR